MESRGWARGKRECGGRVRICRISNRSDVHALRFAGTLCLLTRERRGVWVLWLLFENSRGRDSGRGGRGIASRVSAEGGWEEAEQG
jgi:hypothetical protein